MAEPTQPTEAERVAAATAHFEQRIKDSEYWDKERGTLKFYACHPMLYGTKQKAQADFVAEAMATFAEEAAPGMIGIHGYPADILKDPAFAVLRETLRQRQHPVQDTMSAPDDCCEMRSAFLWELARDVHLPTWMLEQADAMSRGDVGTCFDQAVLETLKQVQEWTPALTRLYPKRAVAVKLWLGIVFSAYKSFQKAELPDEALSFIADRASVARVMMAADQCRAQCVAASAISWAD